MLRRELLYADFVAGKRVIEGMVENDTNPSIQRAAKATLQMITDRE